jgi:hypothetical protein
MFHTFCKNPILFLIHFLSFLFYHLLNLLNHFIIHIFFIIFKISNHIHKFYFRKSLIIFNFHQNNLYNFGFDYFKV